MWMIDFVLLEEDSSYFHEDTHIDALWELVEIAAGQGKGKKKPQTELQHEASFAIDLDGDKVFETPVTADSVQAELYEPKGGRSVTSTSSN